MEGDYEQLAQDYGEEMEEMEEQATGPRGQYTLERCHGGGEESKEVKNNGFAYFCMACYVESGGEQPEKGTSLARLRKHFDAVGHKGPFDENHSAGVRVHLSWKRETVLVSVGTWNRHKPSTATQTAATRSERSNKKRKGSATDSSSWPSSPSSARASLSLPSSSPFPTTSMSSPSQSPSSSLELPLTQPQGAAPWDATGPAGPHGPVTVAGMTPDQVSNLLLQLYAKLERHEQRLIQLEGGGGGGGAALPWPSPYSGGFIGAVGSSTPASVADQQGRLNDLVRHASVSMMTEGHSFITPHGALAQSRGGDRSNLNVHLELVELNGEVTLLPHTADVEDDDGDGDDEPKPPIFPDQTSLLLVSNWPGGSFDGLELVCASQDSSSVIAAGNRLKGRFPIVLTFSGDEVEELRLIDTRASSSSSDSSTSDKEVVWRWRYRIAPPVAHDTDKGVKSSARRVDAPPVRVADQEQDEDGEGEEEDEEPSAATTPAASTPQPRRWWLW
jgi:hypothetical protein